MRKLYSTKIKPENMSGVKKRYYQANSFQNSRWWRFKMRLVVWREQKPDYHETFAPVVSTSSLKSEMKEPNWYQRNTRDLWITSTFVRRQDYFFAGFIVTLKYKMTAANHLHIFVLKLILIILFFMFLWRWFNIYQ